MHKRETPTFPYCRKGIETHKRSPWSNVPRMKRRALNGSTTKQNKQSATHKLQKTRKQKFKIYLKKKENNNNN